MTDNEICLLIFLAMTLVGLYVIGKLWIDEGFRDDQK